MTLLPLDPRRGRDLVTRFSGRHILVLGDVMLDRFIVGDVTRISPEAPVPVVRFRTEYVRLGGAANVAHNLTSLGARVSLVGVVGADQAAERLREELETRGIATRSLVEDAARPTVEKVRIVTRRNQQVARIDYEEDSDASGEVERQILQSIERVSDEAGALVVSDYLKGSVTKKAVQSLIGLKGARSAVLVDPKIPHLDCYAGATLITPNHHEAEAATYRRIRSDEDARQAALDFRARSQCEAALITLGERGMWLSSDESEGAVRAAAREVSDVSGAGDTVVATLALALAAGATLAEAAVLANHAAGLVVGKFGPATLTPEELLAAL